METQTKTSPIAPKKTAEAINKPTSLATPKAIADKYAIVGKLGHGAQGSVFEAIRRSDEKRVAIKQLRIDSVTNWKEYDLFHREAKVLSELNIKGVAHFYEAIEDLKSDTPSAFIVQQLIVGKSLDDMMKSGYRFTVNTVFEMALKLLDILEALHSHQPPVIHRDIKPSNILLQPTQGDDYELYLIDFGAVSNPQIQAGGSTVAGTYGFMPPEQLVGQPEPASDLYALGATLAYMLSGVEPCNMRIADFRLVIDPHLENIPRPIVTLLHKILDPNPKARLTDYNELRKTFSDFAQDRFTLTDDLVLSIEEADKKLAKLRKLNEPGSLDLWMSLPENNPREVPNKYLKRLLKLNIEREQKSDETPSNITESITTGIFIFLTFAPGIIISIILHSNFEFFNLHFCALVTIISLFTTIPLMAKLADNNNKITNFIDKTLTSINKTKNSYETSILRKNIQNDIKTLMIRGRKTIATVVSCTYESIGSSRKLKMLPYHAHQLNYTYNHPPRYKIKYKFNPPDDSDPDDLIHTIYLHHDVTHDFEPGSPLPILYYVNPINKADVMSMPYPLPNDPSISLDNIISYNHDKIFNR